MPDLIGVYVLVWFLGVVFVIAAVAAAVARIAHWTARRIRVRSEKRDDGIT